jgi:CHAT domain-containing protein
MGDANEIEKAIKVWRQEITSNVERATEGLSSLIWSRVAAVLPPDADQVWVSPESGLMALPWQLIGSPRLKPLAVVNSVNHFLQLRGGDRLAGRSVALIGNLDYGPGTPFARLRSGAEEIAAIRGVATEAGLTVSSQLENRDATVEKFLSALSQAAFVHVDTHGFFLANSTNSGLNHSGLALSGANVGWAKADGGLVTADDLLGRPMGNVNLITLSACETGLGSEVQGQGLLGLQAALISNGARSILMSLWPVDERPTTVLMETFYRGLWDGELSKTEALRQAQLEVQSRFLQPYNWAGWILVGEQ